MWFWYIIQVLNIPWISCSNWSTGFLLTEDFLAFSLLRLIRFNAALLAGPVMGNLQPAWSDDLPRFLVLGISLYCDSELCFSPHTD